MREFYDKEWFEGETKSNYQRYTHETCYNDHEKFAKVLIEIVKSSKVLDIGCAKGFLVRKITFLRTSISIRLFFRLNL